MMRALNPYFPTQEAIMIKVSVLYPNEEGKKFDFDYYLNTHLPMVQGLLEPMGLVKGEVEKGVSGADPSKPAPFVLVAHLFFETTEEVHAAFTTNGGQIMGDIKNFTDISPTFQISEVLI